VASSCGSGSQVHLGFQLVYEANLEQAGYDDEALQGTLDVIRKRIKDYGVSGIYVQQQGSDRVIVQIPKDQDVDNIKKLIGQTAQLTFQEQGITADGTQGWVDVTAAGLYGRDKPLTGAYLKPNCMAAVNQPTNKVVVQFEWNSEGGEDVRADHPTQHREAISYSA